MARCPFAQWDPIQKPDGSFWSNGKLSYGPHKIIHHHTEGSGYPRSTYMKGGGVPHFTVSATKIWQHFDTLDAARALYNDTKIGLSPNKDGTIQIEAIGFSGKEDVKTIENVARLCEWIEKEHGIPHVWPMGRPPQGGAVNPASKEVWVLQGGHYGHSQAPENKHKHWDPAYTDAEWVAVNERSKPILVPQGVIHMAAPLGKLDAALDIGGGKIRLVGWALDPDEPSKSISCHLYVNGKIHTVLANVPRPDVNEVLKVTGDHGFSLDVLLPVPVEVNAYALNSTGGDNENSYIGTVKFSVTLPEPQTIVNNTVAGLTEDQVRAITRDEISRARVVSG